MSKKIANFILAHNDEETLQLIHNECSGIIDPKIIYCGGVSFRNADRPTSIFARNKEVYTEGIVQVESMNTLKDVSGQIQEELILSRIPIIGCVSSLEFKSVMKFVDSAVEKEKTLIVYENSAKCTQISNFITRFTQYKPYRHKLKRYQSIKDIVNHLQGAVGQLLFFLTKKSLAFAKEF